MELEFFGANCVRISSKKANIITDDNIAAYGLKSPYKPGDICLLTQQNLGNSPKDAKITIDQPGEYEVSNVSVHGVPARSHLDEEGKKSATIYKITVDDIKFVVLGHIYPELSDDQLEQIGMIDILIVPVGGHGYTLDGTGALKVIKKIDPKMIIPTHYADKAINYEVPQQDLAEALKQMSMEPAETIEKLKFKGLDIPDITKLIVLERQ
jgi:L-ascorbate metabolism protein UlaG (beta-lactamase superfamily)